ncbi:phosphate acyltransferase [Lentisalinibacter orientalis]|uniref:phosphate acyltransferase n=1 Tax=Lentisalinibacter orientalis TaxID=2992241 RepID=UPI003866CF58
MNEKTGTLGTFLAEMESRLAGRCPRLVLPEAEEPRILSAARRLTERGLATVSLVGAESSVRAASQSAGLVLDGIDLVDPSVDRRAVEFATLYRQTRGRTREAVARRLVSRPLFFAGMMVRAGEADALLAGAKHPTARVVEAALMTVGPAAGIATPSSCFLMLLPAGPMVFADCAFNVRPTSQELADIAIASADTCARLLQVEPRVALLSFSTHGSARHPEVDRVREAVDIAHCRAPEFSIDGEMQIDTALEPVVAALKRRHGSMVAGRANVLVFPDLNSGNIAYKLARHLSNAGAVGPILQGFRRPVGDLSRGASVDEIVATATVLLAGSLNA